MVGMKGVPFDPRDHEAFVREIDSGEYETAANNLPKGVVPRRKGMTFHSFPVSQATMKADHSSSALRRSLR